MAEEEVVQTSYRYFDFLIIGGGIAGVSCARTLLQNVEDQSVAIVSSSQTIKHVHNEIRISRTLTQVQVEELTPQQAESKFQNLNIVFAYVVHVNEVQKFVETSDHERIRYGSLALCTGATPLTIMNHPRCLVLRDNESVQELAKKVSKSPRGICVVGNGGIALEIVNAFRKKVPITWAVRQEHIGSTFFDKIGSAFFIPIIFPEADPDPGTGRKEDAIEMETSVSKEVAERAVKFGGAVGPRWVGQLSKQTQRPKWMEHVEFVDDTNIDEHQPSSNCCRYHFRKPNLEPESRFQIPDQIDLHLNCEIQHAIDIPNGLQITLTSGTVVDVDYVISATGVKPNVCMCEGSGVFTFGDDGGIRVNEHLQPLNANNGPIPDIFAAGDCASLVVDDPQQHWTQMRLWTQAQQMGAICAFSMISEDREDDLNLEFNYEMFGHVTQFFGMKCIFLGRWNAQGLGIENEDYNVKLQVKPGETVVKLVLRKSRVVGAMLIGETDLEETMENLILDQIDLSSIEADLFEVDVDLEDMFD